MKTVFSWIVLSFLIVSSSSGFSLNESKTCDYSQVTQGDSATIDANLLQSKELLSISANLLSLSLAMLQDPSNTNVVYVNAMLRLSDDIGKMADRIGEMADRIVATELQIGVMADRILETQKLQNQNVALTQANLLKAQENFNKVLIELAN